MVSSNNGHLYSISGVNEKNDDSKRKVKRGRNDFGKKLGIYCQEYCDYTGIHGFKYFMERRTCLEKFCWIFIFILSLAVCIGVIWETYEKWQSSPIIVNFASEENSIYEIPFPAVTICHEVKISRSYFNYSHNLRKVLHGDKIANDDLRKLQYMSLLCSNGDKIPKVNVTDEAFYKFLKEGATKFFRKCVWMSTVYDCLEIFQPIITDEGLCMSFNTLNMEELLKKTVVIPPIKDAVSRYKPRSGKNWTVDRGYNKYAEVETYPRRALLSGSANALIVNMNVDMDDLDYGCTSFQGFQVVLHKAVRYPTVQQHYFRVPLGKSVIVAVSPMQMVTSEKVKRYSINKRKCLFQNEISLKYFAHYTQFNCLLECLTDDTIRKCGCAAFFMPRRNNTPICGNGQKECMTRVKNDLDMAGLTEVINRDRPISRKSNHTFKCRCIPMCTANEYNTEITEIDYDLSKVIEAIGPHILDDEKNSSSQVVIYFKSSHFISYERNELYNHLDFLGNIGGLLGLFVGFSLLSFFEIIYFLSMRLICNIKLYKHWYGKEIDLK